MAAWGIPAIPVAAKLGRTPMPAAAAKFCKIEKKYRKILKRSEGGQRPTERSVSKIIFVKLANFRANISEIQGNFLRSFALSARHLQIVAGILRFEYVVVYWILITETEAILKKKVPKIATGSF